MEKFMSSEGIEAKKSTIIRTRPCTRRLHQLVLIGTCHILSIKKTLIPAWTIKRIRNPTINPIMKPIATNNTRRNANPIPSISMIKLNARPCTKYLSNGDVFGDVSSVIQSKVSCPFTFKPLSVYPTKQIYDDDLLGDISLPPI